MRSKWFFVGNGRTGDCGDAVAASAEAACAQLGWDVADCVVIHVGVPPPRRRARALGDAARSRVTGAPDSVPQQLC